MRILLVEDEEKVARFVARGLKAERYAVDIAADGNAGLEFVRAYPYDLIVLDLNLPGIPGTELLTHIRVSRSTGMACFKIFSMDSSQNGESSAPALPRALRASSSTRMIMPTMFVMLSTP